MNKFFLICFYLFIYFYLFTYLLIILHFFFPFLQRFFLSFLSFKDVLDMTRDKCRETQKINHFDMGHSDLHVTLRVTHI